MFQAHCQDTLIACSFSIVLQSKPPVFPPATEESQGSALEIKTFPEKKKWGSFV